MKRIVVGSNDAGQRIDKFLIKLLFGASNSMIYKWLRKKRVKVNGKKPDISYMLCEGDCLELYINDEFFESPQKRVPEFFNKELPLTVVYEDSNILVADKPSGVAAHGEDTGLLERIWTYLYRKGEYSPESENTFAPALCNRIDRNTSGLVIAAKNAAALRGINEKIRNREINKYYVLRTEKPIFPPEGRIEGYTLKDEKTRKVKFYKRMVEGAKHCVTLYRRLDNEGLTEVQLVTGRTHQIRASFAAMGYPLCGDVKYGAKKNGRGDFQQLRAYRLEFAFSTPAGELEYLKGKTIEVSRDID